MSHSKKNDRWMQIYSGVSAPCYGCDVREVACHDRCEKFAEYRKELKKRNDAKHSKVASQNIRTTAPKRAPKVRRGKSEL